MASPGFPHPCSLLLPGLLPHSSFLVSMCRVSQSLVLRPLLFSTDSASLRDLYTSLFPTLPPPDLGAACRRGHAFTCSVLLRHLSRVPAPDCGLPGVLFIHGLGCVSRTWNSESCRFLGNFTVPDMPSLPSVKNLRILVTALIPGTDVPAAVQKPAPSS